MSFIVYLPKSATKKSKRRDTSETVQSATEKKVEVRYIFRISPTKLICASPEEMTGHSMRYGSLCKNYKMITI